MIECACVFHVVKMCAHAQPFSPPSRSSCDCNKKPFVGVSPSLKEANQLPKRDGSSQAAPVRPMPAFHSHTLEHSCSGEFAAKI